jgi:hypothetical protein
VLIERKAELLALEHRIARRIRRSWVTFITLLVVSNLITGTIAVTVALSLAHDIWRLRPWMVGHKQARGWADRLKNRPGAPFLVPTIMNPDPFLPSREISLDILPAETIQRLETLAEEEGITVQDLVTRILDREIAKALGRNN